MLVVFREGGRIFISRHPSMEQLAEINFIATLEGQEEERAMAKIVSTPFLSNEATVHAQMCIYLDFQILSIQMRPSTLNQTSSNRVLPNSTTPH